MYYLYSADLSAAVIYFKSLLQTSHNKINEASVYGLLYNDILVK